MATFRCKRSGNTISFINAGDIEGLRKHEGYTEVIENVETVKTIEIQSQEAPIKEVLKVGRKPKSAVPSFLE